MHEDVLREDVFTELARTNDDSWFWVMAIRNDVKIKVVENNIPELIYVKNTQEGRCLNTENDKGLFWRDFDNLMKKYPEVDQKLRKEWNSINNEKK